MAKYIVKHTTIMHSGKTYPEGSEIELTDNEALRLEDFVVAIPKQTTSNKTNSTSQNKTQSSKTSTKSQSTTNADGDKEDGSSESEGGGNDGNK